MSKIEINPPAPFWRCDGCGLELQCHKMPKELRELRIGANNIYGIHHVCDACESKILGLLKFTYRGPGTEPVTAEFKELVNRVFK